METTTSAKFIAIIPRHRRALEMLMAQKKCDRYGGIGTSALRDEEDVFTLDAIVQPLLQRGLIEDLTATELGPTAGRFFTRITWLGELCLGIGYMPRDPQWIGAATVMELKALAEESQTVIGTA